MAPRDTSIEESNVFVALADGVTARIGRYPEQAPNFEFVGTTAPNLAIGGFGGNGWSSRLSPVIYTNESDMPSLRELLAEHRVISAVYEREAPQVPVAVASGLAVAVASVGFTLLAIHISGTPGPDPLISAFLALAGLALIATVVTAIRTR